MCIPVLLSNVSIIQGPDRLAIYEKSSQFPHWKKKVFIFTRGPVYNLGTELVNENIRHGSIIPIHQFVNFIIDIADTNTGFRNTNNEIILPSFDNFVVDSIIKNKYFYSLLILYTNIITTKSIYMEDFCTYGTSRMRIWLRISIRSHRRMRIWRRISIRSRCRMHILHTTRLASFC